MKNEFTTWIHKLAAVAASLFVGSGQGTSREFVMFEFMMENPPIKVEDMRVPQFQETSVYIRWL